MDNKPKTYLHPDAPQPEVSDVPPTEEQKPLAAPNTKRVLQPVTPGFTAPPPNIPAPTPSTAPAAPPPAPIPTTPPTHSFHALPEPDMEQLHRDTQAVKFMQRLTKVIIAVGVYLTIGNMYELLRIYLVHGGPKFGFSLVWHTLLSAAGVILAIGIVRRTELARSLYVMMAVIVMVVNLNATFKYVGAYYDSTTGLNRAIAHDEELIILTQKTNYPAEKKAAYIATFQRAEQNERALAHAIRMTIWPVIVSWTISLIPLIFLSLRRVKALFA